MDINLGLTIFFGLVGFAGVGASVYYGNKSSELEKSKVSLDFEDLSSACSDIADFLKGKSFEPDIVYTPGAKSAILAELISQKFTHEPLVIVGCVEWKESGLSQFNIGHAEEISNNKWRLLVPELLIANSDKKILLVDDITMSGDGLTAIISILKKHGFKNENLQTATLVCTSVAIASKKAPDYFWKQTEGTTFYFPWGKTR